MHHSLAFTILARTSNSLRRTMRHLANEITSPSVTDTSVAKILRLLFISYKFKIISKVQLLVNYIHLAKKICPSGNSVCRMNVIIVLLVSSTVKNHIILSSAPANKKLHLLLKETPVRVKTQSVQQTCPCLQFES